MTKKEIRKVTSVAQAVWLQSELMRSPNYGKPQKRKVKK